LAKLSSHRIQDASQSIISFCRGWIAAAGVIGMHSAITAMRYSKLSDRTNHIPVLRAASLFTAAGVGRGPKSDRL
jgi:hypothetical protein